MRLFELEGGKIPDFSQFINDQLIDDIIKDGKWVSHGSELEEWWNNSYYASDNADQIGIDPEIENRPFAEVRYTPEFRKCVAHWLPVAASQFHDILVNGSAYEKLPPFGPNTILYRCMTIEDEWLADPNPDFGIYWTAVPSQAKRFFRNKGKNVWLTVRAGDVSVNWYETFRSRIDYSNGCDEHEFQLFRGSDIGPVTIKVLGGSGPNITRSGKA